MIKFPAILAYNMPEKKVACVLIQPAMGGTIPTGCIGFLFHPDTWELDPSKCKLYTVENMDQLRRISNLTNLHHQKI